MTPEQAIQILEEATAQARLLRNEHQVVQTALAVLRRELVRPVTITGTDELKEEKTA